MPYGDSKYLTRKTTSDKILRDKVFYIAKHSKYDGYQRGLASTVYIFYDKKTSGGAVKSENISNKGIAEELHKPIIRKFEKGEVHSSFIDNIWIADLAEMQLISEFNKGFRFLLCVIDIFNKYSWVINLKDKKGITNTNTFQKILKESNCKPNKILVHKGGEFYNRSMK